ncbi:MAG: hypothetical protein II699_08125 [Lachnospiraceae bacterium]|nr:hypothetical protein [Lachnospiraceae bacterium]
MKVNKYVKGAVRQFSYWFAHGTIGADLLKDIDYTSLLKDESSFAEQAYVIFLNNLEYDDTGVQNYKYAELRAAQYVRSYFDASYSVTPPFESWEIDGDPVSDKNWNA